jgi:hypothetical protein
MYNWTEDMDMSTEHPDLGPDLAIIMDMYGVIHSWTWEKAAHATPFSARD